MRSERRVATCLVGTLVVGRVLAAPQRLVVAVEILSHLQMRFEHWNRLIDVDSYFGIARKLALRSTEGSKGPLMIADVHTQESFVELAPFRLSN